MACLNSSWKNIYSLGFSSCEDHFWNALKVWDQRPNLLNKRILGVEVKKIGNFSHLLSWKEIQEILSSLRRGCLNMKEIDTLIHSSFGESEEIECRYEVFFKINIMKKESHYGVSVYDRINKSVTFIKDEEKAYSIRFCQSSPALEFLIPNDSDENVYKWELETLLPKIKQWSMQTASSMPSLSLISIKHYCEKYIYLKEKYVSQLKEIWTECTDPDKFIHEDIAIAAYLLSLWSDLGSQRFLDIGCGNGLLVFILNSEGHKGIGYDLRPRKIWSAYPPHVILEVKHIEPSIDVVFPDTDWIIGNHSDELTLWIPIFAARNSYKTEFFLLPCCTYNLDGSKYRRQNSFKSQYGDFMDFVESTIKYLGFTVKSDKLRIPSTKRTCFTSYGRTYSNEEWPLFTKQRVDALCRFNHVAVRPVEIPVTNCTSLDSDVKESLLREVTSILLSNGSSQGSWNQGSPIELPSLGKALSPYLLKALKNESKGLQTFLKNNHHIFQVENGVVTFRYPQERKVDSKHFKTKKCWFFYNHPNSCPLSNEKCSYIH